MFEHNKANSDISLQTLRKKGFYNVLSKKSEHFFDKLYIDDKIYIPYSQYTINNGSIEIKEPIVEINGKIIDANSENIPLFRKEGCGIFVKGLDYFMTTYKYQKICLKNEKNQTMYSFIGNDDGYFEVTNKLSIELLKTLVDLKNNFKIKISDFDHLLITNRKINIVPIG